MYFLIVKRSTVMLSVYALGWALRLFVWALRLSVWVLRFVDEERRSTPTGRWVRYRGTPQYVDKSLGTSSRNAAVSQQVDGYVDKEPPVNLGLGVAGDLLR